MKRPLILTLSLMIAITTLTPLCVHADSSNYSFGNDSEKVYVCVHVYNGGDLLCAIPKASHSLAPGDSASGSCDGSDCKYNMYRNMNGEEDSYCSDSVYGCSDCPEEITTSCDLKIANDDTCTYTGTFNDSEDQVSGDTISCDSSDSTVEYSDDRQIP